uniref:neurofibromin-like n=1 Tax=Oncorhynchus gorbuscha TaxID=8017 RepID=UPI001EAE99A8|nr:neurofibromin-like [Oncorhynchus gorbuscha]
MQYINVDCSKLKRLLQETVLKFKALKKPAQLAVINSLEKAFWNWEENYPDEFTMLLPETTDRHGRCCLTWWTALLRVPRGRQWCGLYRSSYSSSVRDHTHHLSRVGGGEQGQQEAVPGELEEGSSRPGGQQATNRECSHRLCQTVQGLHLHQPGGPLGHLPPGAVHRGGPRGPALQPHQALLSREGSQNADVDLMIDCFVSCFRINPHNNQHFKVCLASASPSTFHFVLVNSLHRIITNSDLDWWPKIDAVYCYSGELRLMFSDTLSRVMQGLQTHAPLRMRKTLSFKEKMTTSLKFKEKTTDLDTRSYKCLLLALVKLIHADPKLMLHNPGKQAQETQSSTAELIAGLVQLVPLVSTAQLSQEAMEALLVLHLPETIELWNPQAPIETFWDISSLVLFLICKKLIGHQMVNSTEVLKWLREILICRNKFLLKNKECATQGSGAPSADRPRPNWRCVYTCFCGALTPRPCWWPCPASDTCVRRLTSAVPLTRTFHPAEESDGLVEKDRAPHCRKH